MYGWPLNNTGLNYTFHLHMDFFFPVVIPQYYMIHGWLHPQIFDWAAGWCPFPCTVLRSAVFENVNFPWALSQLHPTNFDTCSFIFPEHLS